MEEVREQLRAEVGDAKQALAGAEIPVGDAAIDDHRTRLDALHRRAASLDKLLSSKHPSLR